MLKPGGTGTPSTDVISARLAPLPPRRSFISIGGLRCLWSKAKTNGIKCSLATGEFPGRAWWPSEGEPAPKLLDEALDGHPYLLRRVPLPDGDGLVLERVEVHSDAVRRADLVLAPVAAADRLRVVVLAHEVGLKQAQDLATRRRQRLLLGQ